MGASGDAGGALFGGSAELEAIDALTVLGYTRVEAARAVRRLSIPEGSSTEDILKQALRVINK